MNVLLEVTNLSLNYGGAAALAGVSLQIYKGEMVALIGANLRSFAPSPASSGRLPAGSLSPGAISSDSNPMRFAISASARSPKAASYLQH